jgi:hypothetical protein
MGRFQQSFINPKQAVSERAKLAEAVETEKRELDLEARRFVQNRAIGVYRYLPKDERKVLRERFKAERAAGSKANWNDWLIDHGLSV